MVNLCVCVCLSVCVCVCKYVEYTFDSYKFDCYLLLLASIYENSAYNSNCYKLI